MRTNDPGSQFGFLMVPKFSLGALSSAIESLRLANYVSGQTLYEWRTVSVDGGPVASSAGLSVAADLSMDAAGRLSTVFVCGGIDTHLFEDARLAVWLRQIERRGFGRLGERPRREPRCRERGETSDGGAAGQSGTPVHCVCEIRHRWLRSTCRARGLPAPHARGSAEIDRAHRLRRVRDSTLTRRRLRIRAARSRAGHRTARRAVRLYLRTP